jgi:hypothetical protein
MFGYNKNQQALSFGAGYIKPRVPDFEGYKLVPAIQSHECSFLLRFQRKQNKSLS